jgi:hypothetical protein
VCWADHKLHSRDLEHPLLPDPIFAGHSGTTIGPLADRSGIMSQDSKSFHTLISQVPSAPLQRQRQRLEGPCLSALFPFASSTFANFSVPTLGCWLAFGDAQALGLQGQGVSPRLQILGWRWAGLGEAAEGGDWSLPGLWVLVRLPSPDTTEATWNARRSPLPGREARTLRPSAVGYAACCCPAS